MYKYILILLFLTPSLAHSQQPVKPIISSDYLSLITTDSLPGKTGKDPSRPPLQIKQPYPTQIQIKTIKERRGNLTIIPVKTNWLTLTGNYTVTAALTSINTTPYNNDLFRVGHLVTHSLSIKTNIKRSYYEPRWALSLKAATNAGTMVLPENRNTFHSLATQVERYWKTFSATGSYSYFTSRFSNDNSNGFLNRVYQDALQGNHPDNSLFLLKNNGHYANRTQQTANLSLQEKHADWNAGLTTTLDAVADNSNLSIKPGTAFYPTGIPFTRSQNDDHYSSNAWVEYRTTSGNNLTSTARLNYIYNNEQVNIINPVDRYTYQRSSSDAAFTVKSTYYGYPIDGGFNFGNKFYASNTGSHNKFFLPELSAFIGSHQLLNYHLDAKFVATYTAFCSEPSISHPLSGFMLTQLRTQDAFSFMPSTEVSTFNNLAPMQHQEFTSWLQLTLNNHLGLHADFSIRNTKDNVFPTYELNRLILKNIADTRYKGLEVELQYNTWVSNLNTSHSVSFYKFSNIVTRVQAGYDHHPIAGFANVYKALVKDQPVGVIMEDTYQPSIIGDPTPDYTLKFSNVATRKAFSINLDWEYRKGGDVWNGTAATLNLPKSAIQKGDNIRIHTLSLSYDIKIKEYLQKIRLTAYAQNLLLWTAYKGADPNQLLYDQPGTAGLDFFNLPSTKTFGLSASLQF